MEIADMWPWEKPIHTRFNLVGEGREGVSDGIYFPRHYSQEHQAEAMFENAYGCRVSSGCTYSLQLVAHGSPRRSATVQA
jgi:hypothetical protein